MNLAELLEDQARRTPDAAAIIDVHRGADRVTRFGDLNLAAGRVSAVLKRQGLKPGDTVLVLQPMSAELYIMLSGLFRAGLVAMLVDPSAGMDHLASGCALHPPTAMIGSPRAHWLRLISPALRRIPLKFFTRDLLTHKGPSAPIVRAEAESPALITFTSGTTGQPKAALRSHGFLKAQHEALQNCIRLETGESDLSTLPVFVLANLASGVTSLIPNVDLRHPGRIDAAPVIDWIRRHRPSRASASPAFFERLISGVNGGPVFDSFTKLFTGGAPVFFNTLQQLRRIAPRADVAAVYGSTEAEPIAHLHLDDATTDDVNASRHGAGLLAGKPVPQVEVRILPDQWGRAIGPFTIGQFDSVCLPADVSGEIVVSGQHVLPGYLRGLGDSETKFKVDAQVWHRTGDAGVLDSGGRLWLHGRCSARLKDDRGAVYPLQIEAALDGNPRVRRAAALPHRSRRVLAIETAHPSPAGIASKLREELSWAHIDDVVTVKQIPVDKRHNAKNDYRALRKLLDAAS